MDEESKGSRKPELESYLLQRVQRYPGTRFTEIVTAARERYRVSRATVARHLSRLLKFGDIRMSPAGGYVMGNLSGPDVRPVVEIRRIEEIIFVRPDGSLRSLLHHEFRVVRGTLPYVETAFRRSPRQLNWWCSVGSALPPVVVRKPESLYYQLRFEPALTAKTSVWQNTWMNLDMPRWYRMVRPAGSRAPGRAESTRSSTEMESIGTFGEGRNFASKPFSDAYLRLQVIFPDGYPAGASRSKVSVLSSPQSDLAEEARLHDLERDARGVEGLRRWGSSFSMTVRDPVPDRFYEVWWDLPSPAQYRRWLAQCRRHAVR